MKVEDRLIRKLGERGFDPQTFAGLTVEDLKEILVANLKPGDIFYGIRLMGIKK